jgi:hypothetical protein
MAVAWKKTLQMRRLRYTTSIQARQGPQTCQSFITNEHDVLKGHQETAYDGHEVR